MSPTGQVVDTFGIQNQYTDDLMLYYALTAS